MNSTELSLYESKFSQSKGAQFKRFIDYYEGEVPIKYRHPLSPLKVDSQINIHADFFNDIINLKTGYFGSDQSTIISVDDENKKLYLNQIFNDNNIAAKNAETTKMSAIAGLSSRLLYIKDGKIRIKNLPATQVIYEYEDDMLNPTRAIVYYSIQNLLGETKWYCDVYDKNDVSFFEKQYNVDAQMNGVYTPRAESKPHLFDEVPVIAFLNNNELKSNCQATIDMMNAYDEVLSDAASEIKASRNAYLKIFGDLYTGVDADGNPIEMNKALQELNAFVFGVNQDGTRYGDAEFLEKTLNHDAIEKMLTVLRGQIYEQSNSIDIRDLMSNANQRVFTTKIAMMRLEADCKQTETWFNAAFDKQNRLISQYAKREKNITFVDTDFRNIFTRTFPQDLQAVVGTYSALTAAGMPIRTSLELSEIVSVDKIEEVASQIEEQGSALPSEVIE